MREDAAGHPEVHYRGDYNVLAGSDCPHQIGSIPSMKEALASLRVSDEERSAICGGNAARLLEIDT